MNDSEPASAERPLHSVSLSFLLLNFARQVQGERISMRELKDSLGRRSFGLILFVLAIPNVLPFVAIPGVSSVIGAPILLIAFQMMLGYQHIWLPKWIANSSMSSQNFLKIIEKAAPWLARMEKLLKPRWNGLAKGKIEPYLGAVCVLMAFLLMLPIPLGNLFPAISILLISLGLIERDGVCVAAGLIMSVISVVYLQGLIWIAMQLISNLLSTWFQ